jgi:enoyl-CoA hydratase
MTTRAEAATSYTCFAVEFDQDVAHIRLNRPDAFNAMNREFWNELPAIVRDIDDNARARCIVISSTGRHFSAGMDLKVFEGVESVTGSGKADRHTAMEEFRRHVHHLQGTFTCLDQARMPVLAAIQGACIGGGVDLVSACDIRYATADAFFCIQEINIGMTADVGTLQRLPKLIPDGVARELAYTGRRLSAGRAAELGLVNEVFATHDEMLDSVLATAREIASKSPLAVWGAKEMLLYARDHTVADALDHIATWQTGMFQPGDMLEAFTAKGEGRDPQFPDLAPLRKEM